MATRPSELSWPGQQLHFKVLPQARQSPVRAALLSDSPGAAALPLCGGPSLRGPIPFLPSLRRNFAPRRWNSFVQIKSAAWKYHACLPAKAPTSLNMTKVADGLLAFPLEGTGGASEGQKSTPHTLPWESGSGTLAANYRKKQQRSTMQKRRQGYERREAKQSCKHFECENLCHPYPDFPGKTRRM